MRNILCVVLLGLMGAGTMIGCEASAKVDTSGVDDHGSVTKTEVKHESPSGNTVYDRQTETRTDVH